MEVARTFYRLFLLSHYSVAKQFGDAKATENFYIAIKSADSETPIFRIILNICLNQTQKVIQTRNPNKLSLGLLMAVGERVSCEEKLQLCTSYGGQALKVASNDKCNAKHAADQSHISGLWRVFVVLINIWLVFFCLGKIRYWFQSSQSRVWLTFIFPEGKRYVLDTPTERNTRNCLERWIESFKH